MEVQTAGTKFRLNNDILVHIFYSY